jgi:hypothetical protein
MAGGQALAKYLSKAELLGPEEEAAGGLGALAEDYITGNPGKAALGAGLGAAGAYGAHEAMREETPEEKIKKKLGGLASMLGL